MMKGIMRSYDRAAYLEKNYGCVFGGMEYGVNPIQIHAKVKKVLGLLYWQIGHHIGLRLRHYLKIINK